MVGSTQVFSHFVLPLLLLLCSTVSQDAKVNNQFPFSVRQWFRYLLHRGSTEPMLMFHWLTFAFHAHKHHPYSTMLSLLKRYRRPGKCEITTDSKKYLLIFAIFVDFGRISLLLAVTTTADMHMELSRCFYVAFPVYEIKSLMNGWKYHNAI